MHDVEPIVASLHRSQAMSNNNNGSAPGYFAHVGSNDLLTLIIKGARCFVEDQDAWLGD